MAQTYIFGHKNPDTDTITAALATSHLKNKLGHDTRPVRLGEVNNETNYALDYFKVGKPELIERLPAEVEDVMLVDHNEFQQSVENINDVRIIEVIDHHRIANFETREPLYFRVEPVGCTATILKKMYEENKIEITKEIAGLLVSAIISDTLLLKSPTCTQEDEDAARALAEIAGINLEEYGLAMLEAGADLSEKSITDLITMDAKEFEMNGSKVEIAQVNAVDISKVLELQADLEQDINAIVADKKLDLFLFVVTDILNNDSEVIALGQAKAHVEKAFHVKLENNRALLKGVVSRKKQIVTNLTDTFI